MYYITDLGYYYKINKKGKKIRISMNEFNNKIMKGGALWWENMNNSEIKEQFPKLNIKSLKYAFNHEINEFNTTIILYISININDEILTGNASCYIYPDNNNIFLRTLYPPIKKVGLGSYMLKKIIQEIKKKYPNKINNNSNITLSTHKLSHEFFHKKGFKYITYPNNNKSGHYINMSSKLRNLTL
tara:strand:+ start:1389 stop:1946 length:558 start_codon:yes stop_codon:yes gene_type:complete